MGRRTFFRATATYDEFFGKILFFIPMGSIFVIQTIQLFYWTSKPQDLEDDYLKSS